MNIRSILLTALMTAATARGAIIFDNSGTSGQSSAGLGPSTGSQTGDAAVITPTVDTQIQYFDVLFQMQIAGNIEFLILNDSTHAILFQSNSQFFGSEAGPTWKQSTDLSFTLQAGQSYEIGYVSDTNTAGYFGSQAFSQNGSSSANTAVYLDGFDATAAFSYSYGGRDPDVQLEVPEPSSLALIAFTIFACLFGPRLTQRKKRQRKFT